MRIGQQMEQIRQKKNIPVFIICNALNLITEMEYHNIKTGRIQPTAYQMIMFMIATRHHLDL